MSLFFRLIDSPQDQKAFALLAAVRGEGASRFEANPAEFGQISGSPFAYWCPHSILSSFARISPLSKVATATVGLQSSDDFRFLRLWWETADREGFLPFAKGGRYATFFADIYLQALWANEGREIKAYAETTPGSSHWSRNIRSADHYFRPGLTWPSRTNGLSLRVLPAGCIFAHKGPAVFVDKNDDEKLLALCAIMNSTSFNYLVGVQLARTELAQSFEVGLIQQTPVPGLSRDDESRLAEYARRIWSLSRRLASTEETSRAFVLPRVLLEKVSQFSPVDIEAEIRDLQLRVDEVADRAYGFAKDDIETMRAWRKTTAGVSAQPEDGDEAAALSVSDDDALLSWAVGVVFGRFDISLATGERAILAEPSPFAQLSAKSPGMVVNDKDRFAPCSGILVDDAGHPDDIVARLSAVYEHLNVDFVAESVRANLARDFFASHTKSYSRSRRKAPIYWQLATPSMKYSIWLYLPDMNKDTFVRVENDFVVPKLAHERRQLELLSGEAGPNPTAEYRKIIEEHEGFVNELKSFLDEVRRIAPLWNSSVEDGATINAALLWRLFPNNKGWQKETATIWKELCEGHHDWSHLAMHLWPERVVPKCAIDRSIAIAHGLDDVFWLEDEEGHWKVNEKAQASVPKLVRDRNSANVKAALKSLAEAPDLAISTRRTRKSKAA